MNGILILGVGDTIHLYYFCSTLALEKNWFIKNSKDITLFKAATRQPSVFKCEGPVRLHDKPFMSAISCSRSVISNDFNSKTKNIENHIENKIPSEIEVALRYNYL